MNPELADYAIRTGTLAAGAASGAVTGVASAWAIAIFGAPLAVVFAAFSGAMVSLTFLGPATLCRMLAVVLSGTVAGGYMSAFVAEWLGMSKAAMGGIAFSIGGGLQWAIPAMIERYNRKQ